MQQKKINAEIKQLERIKEYTKYKNIKKPNIIKYEPNKNQTLTTNKLPGDTQLDAQQKAAVQSLAKNFSKGNGFKIY